MVYGIAAVVISGRRWHHCLQNVRIAGNDIVHAAGTCCDPQAVGSEDSSPLYDHGKPDTCNDEDQREQQNVFLDGVWSYRLRTDRLFPAGAPEQQSPVDDIVSDDLLRYFTAFSYLFIYLYLLAVIWQQDRQQIWKPLVCGGSVVLLFVAWLIRSDFFHLLVSDGNPTNQYKFGIYEFFDFIFGTRVKYATKMGELLFVLTLVCAILFWKRLGRRNGVFAVLCTCIFPVSYLMAALLALHASHFFTYRHVMHSMGLFWLGMAIILSRINLQEWIACLSFTVWMGVSSYGISYHEEYSTIPHLEETKAFIAENMEPGDVVVYDTDSRFGQLFGCYMPDQIFYTMEEVPDLEELVGKRVWYFQCFGHLLEESDKYTVTYENMGHYGFQYMDGNTDFDILKVNITEETGND